MPNIPSPDGREYDFNPFILAAHKNSLLRERIAALNTDPKVGCEYAVRHKPTPDWYRNTLYPGFVQVRQQSGTHPHTINVLTPINKHGPSGYSVNIYSFCNNEQFEMWRVSERFDPYGYYRINGPDVVLAFETNGDFFGEVGTHHAKMFPGDRLFQLKATHGVPLEISLENLTRRSMVVDWVGFIKEARKSGWYDFQTVDVIQNALADVFDRDDQHEIIQRVKRFIMNNPIDHRKTYPERVTREQVGEILVDTQIDFNEFRASCRASEDGMWSRDEVYEVIEIIQRTPVVKLP